jgi:hypothetical protein
MILRVLVAKRKSCHKGSKTQRFTKFMNEEGLHAKNELLRFRPINFNLME